MKGYDDDDRGRYRYWSWRAWDASLPTLGWIILRPNDRVLSNLMGWSFRAGYGSVSVVHLFAARATSFQLLMAMQDPVGPENDEAIFSRMGESDRFICAWTDSGRKRGRSERFLSDPRWASLSGKAYCLGISSNHQPYFGFRKIGGMAPFQTPRVSD